MEAAASSSASSGSGGGSCGRVASGLASVVIVVLALACLVLVQRADKPAGGQYLTLPPVSEEPAVVVVDGAAAAGGGTSAASSVTKIAVPMMTAKPPAATQPSTPTANASSIKVSTTPAATSVDAAPDDGDLHSTGPCSWRVGRSAFLAHDNAGATPGLQQLELGFYSVDARPRPAAPTRRAAMLCTSYGASNKYRRKLQFTALTPNEFDSPAFCGMTPSTSGGPRLLRVPTLLVTEIADQFINHNWFVSHQLISIFFAAEVAGVALPAPVGMAVWGGFGERASNSLMARWLTVLSTPSAADVVATNDNVSTANNVYVASQPVKDVLSGPPGLPNSFKPDSNTALVCANSTVVGWKPVFVFGAKQIWNFKADDLQRFRRHVLAWSGLPANTDEPPADGAVRILVVKRKTRSRGMLNLPTLLEKLQQLNGFRDDQKSEQLPPVVVTDAFLEGTSVADQAKLYLTCDVMLAVHGAAHSTIWLMRRGGLVIELGPDSPIAHRYFRIGVNNSRTIYGWMSVTNDLHHNAIRIDPDLAKAAAEIAPPEGRSASRIWKHAEYDVGAPQPLSEMIEAIREWMRRTGRVRSTTQSNG